MCLLALLPAQAARFSLLTSHLGLGVLLRNNLEAVSGHVRETLANTGEFTALDAPCLCCNICCHCH